MLILKGTIGPNGIIVKARLGLSATEAQQLRMAGRPVPPGVDLFGLVDTGSDCTCVDPPILSAVGASLAGFTFANRPALGGLTLVPHFDVSLALVHPSGNRSDDLVIRSLSVIELQLPSPGFQALFGRDVLSGRQQICDGTDNTLSLAY
jgi:hypothetical protein